MSEKTIQYDEEHDILYFNAGEKVKDSLDIGDFVLDFSYDGHIVGIEVMNAQENLSEMFGDDVSIEDLKNVSDANISVKQHQEFAFITFLLFFGEERERQKENLNLSVPATAVSPA